MAKAMLESEVDNSFFGGRGSVRSFFWYSGYVVSAPPFAASTGTPYR
jgi:hypothetical protein